MGPFPPLGPLAPPMKRDCPANLPPAAPQTAGKPLTSLKCQMPLSSCATRHLCKRM